MEMIDQEIMDVWKDESLTERDKFDIYQLLIDLKDNIKSVDKRLHCREQGELGGWIIKMLSCEFFLYKSTYLSVKITCVLCMIYLVWDIFKFIKRQGCKYPKDQSFCFLNELENTKAYLFEETQKLNTSSFKYLLLLFVVNILLSSSIHYDWPSMSIGILPFVSIGKFVIMMCIIAVYTLMTWLYRRSLRRMIKPTVKGIENLLNQLERVG